MEIKELQKRIEKLEAELNNITWYLSEFEFATAKMVTEKIEEATSGLVSIEELEYYG